jgi:hypothetical protein
MKNFDPTKIHLEIQFWETLRDTSKWIQQAEELLDAAYLLESEIQEYWSEVKIDFSQLDSKPKHKNVQSIYLLIIAYALENYFKAILIHKNRKELHSELLTEIPSYIFGHDLKELAKKTSINLTIDEEGLLTRLSRLSIWEARYPVPTRPNPISSIEQFSDGNNYFIAYTSPNDINLVHSFVQRIQENVIQEIEKEI